MCVCVFVCVCVLTSSSKSVVLKSKHFRHIPSTALAKEARNLRICLCTTGLHMKLNSATAKKTALSLHYHLIGTVGFSCFYPIIENHHFPKKKVMFILLEKNYNKWCNTGSSKKMDGI